MLQVSEILQCPVCATSINQLLECPICGEKYVVMNDVYLMVNKKLSHKEWKWDQSVFTEEKMRSQKEKYQSYLNEETKNAQIIWWAEMNREIGVFKGIVGDLATGLGGMFERLMRAESEFTPIATDVDPNVLAWTTKTMKAEYKKEFISVATDGKHFAFQDDTFNIITSCAGLNNIPNTRAVISELYRTLKKDGMLTLMHSFIDSNSASYKLAKEYNVERPFVKQLLIEDLSKAGFKNVTAKIVSSAIWAGNPMDGLPAANDMQYYAIIINKGSTSF